jgi:hypothetical protein
MLVMRKRRPLLWQRPATSPLQQSAHLWTRVCIDDAVATAAAAAAAAASVAFALLI